MDEEIFARGTVASQATPQKEKQNSRTVIHVVGGAFSREPLSGQIALARYEASLRMAAREHARDRVFVAVVDSDGRQTRHEVIAPGESLVFGRHDHARLHHAADDVSLRHVAIAVAPSSTAEAPLLRVWDLATGKPFKTEDGMLTKALTADGPVFATIGSVFISIIPLGCLPDKLPLGTLALWLSLPERDVISRVAEGTGIRFIGPEKKRHAGRTTMITRIGAASGPRDCSPELAVAEMSLSTDSSYRRYRISMEALERGILIGRYERCLNLGEEISVLSRVHLLISKIGKDVVAIDTASTYGSVRQAGAFESAVLEDKDGVLLADALFVQWVYKRPMLA